jgi:hypothetical protein
MWTVWQGCVTPSIPTRTASRQLSFRTQRATDRCSIWPPLLAGADDDDFIGPGGVQDDTFRGAKGACCGSDVEW